MGNRNSPGGHHHHDAGHHTYGNGVFHINGILQPSTTAKVPLVGVAITTGVPIPGIGTAVTHVDDVDSATRFCLEAAKAFGAGSCRFYDDGEHRRLVELYGDLSCLQTLGQSH